MDLLTSDGIGLQRPEVDDDDGDYGDIFARPARNSGWWKERLGLKKPNSLHRKCKSSEIVLETVAEEGNHNIFAFAKKENQVKKSIRVCVSCTFYLRACCVVILYQTNS